MVRQLIWVIVRLWAKKPRGHSELNQGPAGLQPDALPLSYIPNLIKLIVLLVRVALLWA